MIKFIKDTFSTLTVSFLIRNYVFGLIIYSFMMYVIFYKPDDNIPYDSIIIFTINLILFPFATLVWEELRNLFLGNNILIAQVFVMLLVKFFIKVFIFYVSFIIGPLGILYLWYIRRKNSVENNNIQ